MSHLTEGKTCEMCDQPFTPKRSDAVCCGAKCRRRKSRVHQKAVKLLTDIANDLDWPADDLIDWYQHDMTDVARLPIADREMMVENKYRGAFMSPNLSFLMITTNDTHAITAGVAARRFFVLDVSTDKAGDREYFNALADQASNGGLEALMYDLIKRNLSNFNMRDVPKTDELQAQQKMSVNSIDEWLMECCEAGILVDGTVNQFDPPAIGAWIYGGEVTATYSKWCSTNKRHKENSVVFGKHMVNLGMPSVQEAGKGNTRKGRYIKPADALMTRIEGSLMGR